MNDMIADALRLSLDRQWLRLVFQPQFTLGHDRQVVGAEALLRWHHPQFGEIPPAEFIPVAERSDLIIDIDRWVYDQLLQMIQGWRNQGITPPPISMNLSPCSLLENGFADRLIERIDGADIPPSLLRLEITEQSPLEITMASVNNLHRIKQSHIDILIDDFGMSYASFSYLKQKIASELKIDINFTAGIGKSIEDEAIIKAIINLVNDLDLKVIAEGIETENQRQWLWEAGCQIGQGFLLSRPLEYRDYDKLISAL